MTAPAVSEPVRPEALERLRERLREISARPSPTLEPRLATDIPEVDRLLEGGFPAGIIATIEGATGRWSLAAGLLARMTRRSLVAILDDGALYPPSLVEAGVRLDRVLVVPARGALAIARAVDVLLRSRICRLVLMPAIALRDALWTRLATARAPQRRALDRRGGARRRRFERGGGSAAALYARAGFHARRARTMGKRHRLRALRRRAQARASAGRTYRARASWM